MFLIITEIYLFLFRTHVNVKETYDFLRGIDNLEFAPKIMSSTEGEIANDNPNYEFSCILKPKSGYFEDEAKSHDMNPEKTKDFTYKFTENVGSYNGIYTVKDKRTGVTTYYTFTVNLKSSVYEGWMVLCNEGEDNRVRLDMVSVISREEGRISPVYDVLNSTFPEQHGATQIMFDHSMYTGGDYIYLMSETGSYKLDKTELTAEEIDNVKNEYLSDLGNDVPIRFAAMGCTIPGAYAHIMTTKDGNAYINGLSGVGASYEFPANTSTELSEREYRVSPYIGVGMSRTGIPFQVSSSAVLLYDIDNKRFMGWDPYKEKKLLYEIPESGATFMPFKTGKDLVYMEGTKENAVNTILQDNDGSRSVLVINLTDDQYRQTNYYENIQAENFNSAKYFAFHSLYAYMFYGYGSKLYTYSFSSNSVSNVIDLPGEDITMVKIDLFKWVNPGAIPEDMKAQEHYVLVGSYRQDATDNNGGILRMYKLNTSEGKLEEVSKYDGFAKIVDVTYRERF